MIITNLLLPLGHISNRVTGGLVTRTTTQNYKRNRKKRKNNSNCYFNKSHPANSISPTSMALT